MKSDNDVINIYWAPASNENGSDVESEMLYPNPTNLYDDLFKIKNKELKFVDQTFFACPAIQSNFKNTFVFKNVVKTNYNYNYTYDTNNLEIGSDLKIGLPISSWRPPVVSYGPQIIFGLGYLFFADQSIDAYLNSPTFHKAGYTNYGTIFPGSFDIGQWFRPYFFEVQTWNQTGKFIIEDDEPIFYLSFKTNKKIKLHRFKNTKLLSQYANHCVGSSSTIKSKTSLAYRYKIFNQSSLNKTVLKEIKKNLIGENNE
jgi:hypothetical protein